MATNSFLIKRNCSKRTAKSTYGTKLYFLRLTHIKQIWKGIKNMFCPKCGSKIGSGASFCVECGTKISVSAPSVPSASIKFSPAASAPAYGHPTSYTSVASVPEVAVPPSHIPSAGTYTTNPQCYSNSDVSSFAFIKKLPLIMGIIASVLTFITFVLVCINYCVFMTDDMYSFTRSVTNIENLLLFPVILSFISLIPGVSGTILSVAMPKIGAVLHLIAFVMCIVCCCFATPVVIWLSLLSFLAAGATGVYSAFFMKNGEI